MLAVYKQDVAAERQRRIVAMRLQTDKLGDVHALVEQVACSRSAPRLPRMSCCVVRIGLRVGMARMARVALLEYDRAGSRAVMAGCRCWSCWKCAYWR